MKKSAEKYNSPLTLISNLYPSLSKSEKKVATYIQEHMDEAILLSLQGVAKKCGTSDPTVLRFCRALGYQGFSDFKASLVPELLRNGKKVYVDLNSNGRKDTKELLKQNLLNQTEATLTNVSLDEVNKVARKIIKTKRFVVIGLGGSAGVAKIFCDSLGSLGIFSACFSDRSIIQNIASNLKSQDVLFGISHSGETVEVVAAVKKAKNFGVFTVGLTNSVNSSLANNVNVLLKTAIPANMMGSYSCQARISQLVILELILNEITKLFAKSK